MFLINEEEYRDLQKKIIMLDQQSLREVLLGILEIMFKDPKYRKRDIKEFINDGYELTKSKGQRKGGDKDD